MTITTKRKKQIKKRSIAILAGLLYACALNIFIVPSHLFSGGITGISQILTAIVFQSPDALGYVMILLNLPFIIFGFLKLNNSVVTKTCLFILSYSIFSIIIPVHQITDSIMLNIVFGGFFIGLASGLVLKYGGASSSINIIAIFLSLKAKNMFIGRFSLWVDTTIFILLGVFVDWNVALCSIVCAFITTTVIDLVNTNTTKMSVKIVTNETEEICQMITNKMNSGAYYEPIVGAYSHEEKTIITTIISQYKLNSLLEEIDSIDEEAFVTTTKISQIRGGVYRTPYKT